MSTQIRKSVGTINSKNVSIVLNNKQKIFLLDYIRKNDTNISQLIRKLLDEFIVKEKTKDEI